MLLNSVIVFLFIHIKINAVPPEACFAKFRWEDCGGPPRQVLYYWKPGSRCEVGTWRGCLPNLNMFIDEYECVSTCIFSVRAQPPDYHAILENEEEVGSYTEVTDAFNVTTTSIDDNQTTIEVTTNEANATVDDVGNTAGVVETNATATVETNATATVETNGTAVETDNATAAADGDATAPPDDITTAPPDDNVTAPPDDNATAPSDDNATAPPDENATAPPDENATTTPDGNATATNSTA